jgi:hypothetical protein
MVLLILNFLRSRSPYKHYNGIISIHLRCPFLYFYHRLLLNCAFRYTTHPIFRAKKWALNWNRTVNRQELHPCALFPFDTLTNPRFKTLPCAGLENAPLNLLRPPNLSLPLSPPLPLSLSLSSLVVLIRAKSKESLLLLPGSVFVWLTFMLLLLIFSS